MDPVRKWVLIFSAFCLLLLAWYMAADRYTPFTTQARVNAFVVPIAPQVAGEILSVDVRTNQMVKKGELLARIDPARYELAVASAEAQLALTQQNLKVSSSTVDAAAASLDAAKAALVKDTQNEARLKRIDADVPGAISQRSLEWATTSRIEGEAQVASAKANLQKAIEALGPRDEKNPQLLAARAALDKAKLDLQYTRLVAPNDGLVTDLRVDVGNFAATGQPLMTFVAVQKMWVEANLTENNLGHIKPGDAVDLVLDVWPDKIAARACAQRHLRRHRRRVHLEAGHAAHGPERARLAAQRAALSGADRFRGSRGGRAARRARRQPGQRARLHRRASDPQPVGSVPDVAERPPVVCLLRQP